MNDNLGRKIIAFFALAESIAALFALIPMVIKLFEFKDNPTDIGQLINFFEMLPWFLFGQIPGMLISAVVNGLFGSRRNSGW